METRRIISEIENGNYDNLFLDIYVDEDKIFYQKQRYVNAIESYIEEFGEDDVEIYSAPGRSEVGGNHTDHQHGEILAASINLDAIGIVKKTDDMKVSMGNYSFNKDNIHDIIQDEISKVFVKVLECAGVYKRTEDGMEAFMRFVNSL